ncbi:hypothetical protein AQJ30_07430 [Streptomyces longwoodensis]|uniref:Uncharacterized protein n=1 Tax=Streptomyces longwoodensis TaxID=68231 RepID=A0A124HS39_9ACTN|nr:hypothetical protein AQJ30_07430 [Streptomyces longwoodensis]
MTSESAATEVTADSLGNLLMFLAENGYADQVGSWVSDAVENLPITGAQLLSALGRDSLAQAAAEADMTVEAYAEQLAQELPAAADAVTPRGELLDDEEFDEHLQAFQS